LAKTPSIPKHARRAIPALPEALAAAYAGAKVSITVNGIAQDALDLAKGLPQPVTVITACNPYSRRRRAWRNRLANAYLRIVLWRQLRKHGGQIFRSLGSDTQDPPIWCEPGYALAGLDLELVAGIGKRFRQHAIYVVQPDGLEVRVCAPEAN
jgi:hypothetical protein